MRWNRKSREKALVACGGGGGRGGGGWIKQLVCIDVFHG